MTVNLYSELTQKKAHYVVLADTIAAIKKAGGYSQRQLVKLLKLSKTEVHRMLLIGKMNQELKDSAMRYNIEKYVLIEWDEYYKDHLKEQAYNKILAGEITTRKSLHKHFEVAA